MAHTENILLIGASGQIGTELALALREKYGNDNVVTSDIRKPSEELLETGPHETLNILDKEAVNEVIGNYKVTQVYNLAAILSAKGEQDPKTAWEINMGGLLNVLEMALQHKVSKLFWPSSIAVFGKRTPKKNTQQYTITDPQTIYGISKLAGERWCHYYHHHRGMDIRSLRYPGLISYHALPGGGTTDYAIDIFYQALQHGKYECFLKEETRLPMMYMPDALRGTIELMEADPATLNVHSSYNIAGMSFTPAELAAEIKKHIPSFKITYKPDYRQEIAQNWPESIDDTYSRDDWKWKPSFDLAQMTEDMLKNVELKLKEGVSHHG